MIYLYAITEPDVGAPDCPGLEDQALGHVGAADVGGLYSEHSTTTIPPEPEAAWRHERVLEAAMRLGPVLPARFGTTFADLPALVAALEREHASFRGALERVRGCVELAVRVALPPDQASPSESGREYLRAKLARRQEREAAAERTLVPLSSHAVLSQTPSLESDPGTLRASYLVRADEVPRFAEAVQALAQSNSELALSCTGPWAPYSFVGSEQ